MLRRQVDRPRQGARPGGGVLARQAEDEVEVYVSEAGRRAALKAVSASSALWMRPSQASSPSSKLCTPMLSRLTPMPANAAKCASSTVPGLASLVISASSATSKALPAGVEHAGQELGRQHSRRAAAEEDRPDRRTASAQCRPARSPGPTRPHRVHTAVSARRRC